MKASPLVNLDFEQIKLQLKYFLKNNTKFSDYNYEGSNINQLLDVLAYTTFLNAFQLNLALSELNLETSTLRDNVTSRSQELGYTPNNYNSAKISINLSLSVPNNSKFIEIPPGMLCIGKKLEDNLLYKFNLIERKVLPIDNGVVNTNLELFEGTLITNQYIYDIAEDNRIIIINDKIDINTIRVSVNNIEFYKYDNLIANKSNIFYVNIIQDNNVEIEFGKNIFGTEPNIGDMITVSYITNNGSNGNDLSNLNFVGECKYYYENNTIGVVVPIENIILTVNDISSGGSDTESLKIIKFNAVRHYSAQNRAVVASDYESIIISNFPYVKHVNVIGGEELVPPEYGKVKLTVQTKTNTKLNTTQKNNILNLLKKFNITTTPIIADAKYSKLKVYTYIKYNLKLLSKNIDELRSKVTKIINDYTNTESFDNSFYGNKLESLIYAADKSILSVKIKLVIIDTPTINNNNFSGIIGNGIKNDNCKLYSFLSTPFFKDNNYYRLTALGDNEAITKQKYTFDGITHKWENDSVVGQLTPRTGAYQYTTDIESANISIISIPSGLDIEMTGTIIVPEIIPPSISTTDIITNNDPATEKEYKNPIITKNITNPINTVTLNDIIPLLSSIIC